MRNEGIFKKKTESEDPQSPNLDVNLLSRNQGGRGPLEPGVERDGRVIGRRMREEEKMQIWKLSNWVKMTLI